jgi:hypothetical protein
MTRDDPLARSLHQWVEHHHVELDASPGPEPAIRRPGIELEAVRGGCRQGVDRVVALEPIDVR